jgi:hypothetical protein
MNNYDKLLKNNVLIIHKPLGRIEEAKSRERCNVQCKSLIKLYLYR